MKRLLIILALLVAGVTAQTATPITDHVFEWIASTENDTYAGNPPVALVDRYKIQMFLRSQISGSGNPIGAPAIVVDVGKPPKDGTTGIQQSGPVRLMLSKPNVEYVAYVVANGPFGDTERAGPTEAFFLQPGGGACNPPVTIQVDSYDTPVPVGGRGRVLFRLQASQPITVVQVAFTSQVVGEIKGTDLRDVAGLYFSVPRTPGDYSMYIRAGLQNGCVTSTTAARIVRVQ